jgi:hypothetical protein
MSAVGVEEPVNAGKFLYLIGCRTEAVGSTLRYWSVDSLLPTYCALILCCLLLDYFEIQSTKIHNTLSFQKLARHGRSR